MPNPLIRRVYYRFLSKGGMAMLLILLVLNILGIWSIQTGHDAMEKALAEATRARQAMVSVERLRALIFEGESAQRGFLLTEDREYLKPFHQNLPLMKAELANIRNLAGSREAELAKLTGLEEVTRDKIVEMEKTIALAEFGSMKEARAAVLDGAGKALMDYLDKAVERLVAIEDEVRLDRLAERRRIQNITRWGSVTLFVVNALLILAGAYTIFLEFRRRNEEMLTMARRRNELESSVAQRTAELRELSINLQNVQESERRRLARELHDELGGTLSAIKLDVSLAAGLAPVQAEPKAKSRLERALAALDDAIKVKRRVVEDLRPTLIDNLGFDAALRWHCDQFFQRSGCRCKIDLPEQPVSLTEEQSIALFRVVQESLTNVQKYAKASDVTIRLRQEGECIELSVADNGTGIADGKQHHATSHGLVGMRERMAALGGSFEVETAAGQGTKLIFCVPVIETPPENETAGIA